MRSLPAITGTILLLGAPGAASAAGAMCDPSGWRSGVAYARLAPFENHTAATPAACCSLCQQSEECLAWNQKMPSENCFMWHTVPPGTNSSPEQTSVLGTKFPPARPTPPPPPPPPAPKGALNVLMIAIE